MKKHRRKIIAALLSLMLISMAGCTADGQIDSSGLQSALDSIAAEVSAIEAEESETASETTEPEESSGTSVPDVSETSAKDPESKVSGAGVAESSKQESRQESSKTSKPESSGQTETSSKPSGVSTKPAQTSTAPAKPLQESSETAQTSSKPTQTSTTPVNIPVRSISFDKHEMTLTVGKTGKLNYSFDPANTTEQKIVMKWSNSAVVSFDKDGTVHALSPGTATITIECANGTSDSCTVTVKKAAAKEESQSVSNSNNAFTGQYDLSHYYRSETNSQIEAAEKIIKATPHKDRLAA